MRPDAVDASVLLFNGRDKRVRISRRAHVEFMKLCRPASVGDFGNNSATFLFKNIGHDDFIAGAGESLGGRATDADASACNEDCLTHNITSPELGPIVCPTNRLA